MKLFVLLLILLFFNFCTSREDNQPYKGPQPDEIEASILKVNRYILKRNLDHISGFIKRTGWEMKESGSGLFYLFINQGSGNIASQGQRISLDFNLKLIDGSIINSSEQSGPMEFTIGQGGVPTGLEEAVLNAREGSEMKLILPPHLAYGNFGDKDIGIPPDAILLYEISVNWIK
jgi:FKBP-type peptidyl-prolyl cis-trans isomerase